MAGATVLVATSVGRLVAIDLDSGLLVWQSEEGSGPLRSLALTPDIVVGVRGGLDPGLVGFSHDPDGTLVSLVSPTELNLPKLLGNFLAAAVPLALLLFLAGRWLKPRMGPAFLEDDEDDGDLALADQGIEGAESVTNKRKKKSRPAPRPSGYRDPKPAAPARRRGILDTMFAPGTTGSTSMPRVRTALTRGVVTVLGSPVLFVAPILFLLIVWLVLIAIGYQGPFSPLANLLALPPVGTSVDGSLATGLFGLQGGQLAIVGFLAVRAVVLAFLTAGVVEALEDGRVTTGCVRRAIRALPVTFAVCIVGVGILTLSSFFGVLLGPGWGSCCRWGARGRALPVRLRADHRRRRGADDAGGARQVHPGRPVARRRQPHARGALRRPVDRRDRGARRARQPDGREPDDRGLVFVLVINLLHVVLLATFAFRYLSVAHEVPEPPARPPVRGARGRRRR